MKNTMLIAMACSFLLLSQLIPASASASVLPVVKMKTKKMIINNESVYSSGHLPAWSREKSKRPSGKKMRLIEKIFDRFQKNNLQVPDKESDREFLDDFNANGFILGLFLNVLGVGLAYVNKNRKMIKWAWRGAAISGFFILIALLF
jgi:hypothetical protein